jgi:hypothetical protein
MPRLHGRRPQNRRDLFRHDRGHEFAADSPRLRHRLLALAAAFVAHENLGGFKRLKSTRRKQHAIFRQIDLLLRYLQNHLF